METLYNKEAEGPDWAEFLYHYGTMGGLGVETRARRSSGLKLSVVAEARNLGILGGEAKGLPQDQGQPGIVTKFRPVRLLADFCQNKKPAWIRCNPSTGEVQGGPKFKVILSYFLSLRLA